MNKKKFSKFIFGASLLGCLGTFTPSQAIEEGCGYEDQRSCENNQQCVWIIYPSYCGGPAQERPPLSDASSCKKEGYTWVEGEGNCSVRKRCM